MIRRGDIYYIQPQESVGSEQWSGRPAVVVSNDKNNEFSATVEIVYLTTQPKNELDTHVITKATGVESTALCEQITSVDKSRLGSWKGRCTDDEMEQLNKALEVSVGLKKKYVMTQGEMLVKYIAERDTYKAMYEDLIKHTLDKQ